MSSKKNTKTGQFEKQQNESIVSKAAGITVDSALKTLSTAQATIGKTLAGVGEQIQSQLQELETVSKAVELKKDELEQIHGVEAIAKSIEEMEADFQSRREQTHQGYQQYINDLNVSKDSAQKEHERFTTDLNVTRQRDHSNWLYSFEQEKKTARNTLDEEFRVLRLQERDRKETQERNWAAREEELKKHETEYASLQKQVNDFPVTLKTEVDKAVAIATNSVKRDFTHQFELLKKDSETAARVSENTVATLKQQLEASNTTIAQLQQRLIESEKKVESIANKALDSASGRQALADLQSLNTGRENGSSLSRSKA